MRRLVGAALVLTSGCGIFALRTARGQQTVPPSASIQTKSAGQVDHYTAASLLALAKPLADKAAASNGAAAETLQKYGVDDTMLSFRDRDGQGELHEHYADIFVIMDGSATLLSGGELQEPATSAPGEQKGSAVLHGSKTQLSKGDIVHIPANTPHQLLIPKGSTLTYFVIKVKEKD